MDDTTIAVLLQTADRSKYTVATVDAFLRHNNPGDFRLFLADDASERERGTRYARDRGFELVFQNDTRQGCTLTLRAAIKTLYERLPPETPLLYLQNDVEFVRPLPVALVLNLLREYNVTAVRLYGDWKGYRHRGRARASDRQGKIDWYRKTIDGEEIGFARTKWSHLPHVARLRDVMRFTATARNERDVWRNARAAGCIVARFENNVIYHVGHRRTPNGKYK